jgi:hypothetical protein
VRASQRPLGAVELAEAMRRRGHAQTEKQARATAARAQELGLLRKRGCRWDTPTEEASGSAVGIQVWSSTTEIFVECAWRLLEMPHCLAFTTAARTLLDVASHARTYRTAATRHSESPQRNSSATNGTTDDHRAVEVLEPPHGE